MKNDDIFMLSDTDVRFCQQYLDKCIILGINSYGILIN